eukprot:s4934_g1.t1
MRSNPRASPSWSVGVHSATIQCFEPGRAERPALAGWPCLMGFKGTGNPGDLHCRWVRLDHLLALYRGKTSYLQESMKMVTIQNRNFTRQFPSPEGAFHPDSWTIPPWDSVESTFWETSAPADAAPSKKNAPLLRLGKAPLG